MRSGKYAGPPVSVIVCAYNRYEETMACLESVRRNTDPDLLAEVVLVDDASTEQALAEFVSSSGVRVVRHHRNTGFLDAANDGASVASGRYLFFLNNDATVTPGWLEPLLERIEQPRCGSGRGQARLSRRAPAGGGRDHLLRRDGVESRAGRQQGRPALQLPPGGRLLQRRGADGEKGPVLRTGRIRPGLRARLLRGGRLLLLPAK